MKLKTVRKDLMFGFVNETPKWMIGCTFGCCYCYAYDSCMGRLKHVKIYHEGFSPRIVESEIRKKCKPNTVVFPFSMGDPFCYTQRKGRMVRVLPDKQIVGMFHVMKDNPETTFLWQTKNPEGYHDFYDCLAPNMIAGVTIESDFVPSNISFAPAPYLRAKAMIELDFPNKFVSVEPVMRFNRKLLARWLLDIKPIAVAIGYDNHHKHLPEPSLNDVKTLIIDLKAHGIKVIKKKLREPNER